MREKRESYKMCCDIIETKYYGKKNRIIVVIS